MNSVFIKFQLDKQTTLSLRDDSLFEFNHYFQPENSDVLFFKKHLKFGT
ncbi:hypothetical protein LMANV2_120007 [Leptospira interrogans serovar Manilae]|uniref:Uncharacterized protein n=1 Tax=Leptospira interrogans serovar Manilae TaxID=214675 RepID=A0AAQ1NUF3_LEPIR|nr:hypothetical protein LMANV2_120007 [Leptospira interrogans serovar Manilae]